MQFSAAVLLLLQMGERGVGLHSLRRPRFDGISQGNLFAGPIEKKNRIFVEFGGLTIEGGVPHSETSYNLRYECILVREGYILRGVIKCWPSENNDRCSVVL